MDPITDISKIDVEATLESWRQAAEGGNLQKQLEYWWGKSLSRYTYNAQQWHLARSRVQNEFRLTMIWDRAWNPVYSLLIRVEDEAIVARAIRFIPTFPEDIQTVDIEDIEDFLEQGNIDGLREWFTQTFVPPAKVNKGPLGELLATANELEETDWTPETWGPMVSARTSAQTVYDDVNATQTQVNNALGALNDAVSALQPSE